MRGLSSRIPAAILVLPLLGADLASAGPGTAHPPERAPFTATELETARPAGLAGVRIPGDDPAAFRRLLAAAPAAAEPWLVLSGGGEDGAFAAGLLAGWSAAGDRPAFGVITGVSTGALIAPFAFVGPAGDGALKEAYTTITAADVFEFGGSDVALTDTWPLKRRIDAAVTPALLARVAAEHAGGRRLFVATTEIDAGRPVLWDMGALASVGGPRALGLFRAVVLASAAVPGLFPPVTIEAAARDPATGRDRVIHELHADGGTTAPFYLAPKSLLASVPAGAADPSLPPRTVYLVVNNSRAPAFEMARRSTLSVLGRALSAAIKAQIQDGLALAEAFARRTGLDLRVAEVDARFKRTSPGPFDREYMRALYAHAEGLARSGTAFTGAEPTGAQATALTRP